VVTKPMHQMDFLGSPHSLYLSYYQGRAAHEGFYGLVVSVSVCECL